LCEHLKTSFIRLNSKERIVSEMFEYEDTKLERQNILHLAANGNNCCLKILLNRFRSSDKLSKDFQKRTLMHIASSNSSMECLDTIYNFVEDKKALLDKDDMGFTPLHYAVKYGKLETVIFILSKLQNVDIADGEGINAKNKKGKTALFYAQDSHMMYLLLHYRADPLILVSKTKFEFESLLEYYMRTNPENAIELLNYDIEANVRDTTAEDFVYTYNFRLFMDRNKVASSSNESLDEEEKLDKIDDMAQIMLTQDSSWKLLNAPTAELYLRLKWNLFRKFYFLDLAFYLAFLLSLTSFVYWTSYTKNHHSYATVNTTNVDNAGIFNATDNTTSYVNNAGCIISGWYTNQAGYPWVFHHIWTSLFTLAIFMREIFEIVSFTVKEHFKEKENCFHAFILLVSIAYLILVSLTGDCICQWEQYLGSVSLFSSWIEMTLMIGRIPSVRIYIIMSLKVFKQLVYIFSFYSTTMFAFACAYSLLLPQSPIFELLSTSFIKIIVMMIGEFDFQSNFTLDSANHSKHHESKASRVIAQIIFVAVMFMVALTLANLIIGLTVQNIGELQQEARINMPIKTIEQIKKTESLFKNNWWAKKIIKFLVKITELEQDCFTSRYVLSPKDIVDCKKDFMICVKPDFNKVIHDSSHVMYTYFDVHLYVAGKKDKKMSMRIPEWIVKNTEKALEQRKKIFDDLAKEFEHFRDAQRKSAMLRRFSYTLDD